MSSSPKTVARKNNSLPIFLRDLLQARKSCDKVVLHGSLRAPHLSKSPSKRSRYRHIPDRCVMYVSWLLRSAFFNRKRGNGGWHFWRHYRRFFIDTALECHIYGRK